MRKQILSLKKKHISNNVKKNKDQVKSLIKSHLLKFYVKNKLEFQDLDLEVIKLLLEVEASKLCSLPHLPMEDRLIPRSV
jgi:hypothetical protein